MPPVAGGPRAMAPIPELSMKVSPARSITTSDPARPSNHSASPATLARSSSPSRATRCTSPERPRRPGEIPHDRSLPQVDWWISPTLAGDYPGGGNREPPTVLSLGVIPVVGSRHPGL